MASISSAKYLVSSMVADFDIDDMLATELTTWRNLSGAEPPVVELRGFGTSQCRIFFAELLEASSATMASKLLGL